MDAEDLALHLHRVDARLEVGLHLVLVARVGMHDVPVARAAEGVVTSGLSHRFHFDRLGCRSGRRLPGSLAHDLFADLIRRLFHHDGLDHGLGHDLLGGVLARLFDLGGVDDALGEGDVGLVGPALGRERLRGIDGLFEDLLGRVVGVLGDPLGLGRGLGQGTLGGLLGQIVDLGRGVEGVDERRAVIGGGLLVTHEGSLFSFRGASRSPSRSRDRARRRTT